MSASYVEEFTRDVAIDPRTTALLVIDMQNATGNPERGLGAMLRKQGRFDSARYRFDRIEHAVVPNTRKLLDSFRDAGATVIFITYGAELPDASDVPEHVRKIVLATNNRKGEPEHEIVDALQPRADEPVLNKVTMGAFASTGIDTLLKASDRGYGVVLAEDATGTCSDEMQDAYVTMFRRLWGRIADTDEIIAELNREASPRASAG